MERGGSGLCALVAIDKPAGCSSHDVVGAVRRAIGERRVGHSGTLDPFATGVLVLGIGPATRLLGLLMDGSKVYEARISFGLSTATDDLSGEVVDEGVVPDQILDRGFAARVLAGFVGEQDQVPPAYSAKKKAGRRSYDLAREGVHMELDPVRIRVGEACLLDCGRGGCGGGAAIPSAGGLDVEPSDPRMAELPWWDVRFEVSKGTYVRALARDIGRAVGCGAHLSALRRMATGVVCESDAMAYDDIPRLSEAGFIETICLDPARAMGLPTYDCGPEMLRMVANGAPVSIPASHGPLPQRLGMVHGGRLHAVYTAPADCGDGGSGSAVRYTGELVIPDGVIGVGRDCNG